MKRLGQGDGYAMAALLVAMSVAAILMTVALPVWKQTARRELEEELVFRGLQYTRAIRLFSQKYANAGPPNIDVLVEQRFLRRKYKDPITNDDFRPLLAGQATPGSGTPSSGSRGGTQPQRGGSQGAQSSLTSIGAAASGPSSVGGIGPASPPSGRGGPGTQGGPGGFGPGGGVIGVASKSKAESIRLYNGRNHYDEWAFIFTPQVQAPGAGGGGVGVPGQRGGRGGQQENPFGSGIGGQRGRGGPPNQGPGRGGQQQQPPGRGTSPQSPFGPAQPILPGRGRGL